jgi:transcriptional regulator with XRE-family HTH domain
MNLADIGQLVHARRTALGLSQAQLAAMSGLSRATVNQLEGGSLVELGAAKLITLLDLVGLRLDAGTRKCLKHALQSVSSSASVSYKTVLDPAVLAAALVDGALPEGMTPHIATLLDEAPLSLIVAAVEEVARTSGTPPKLLWRHVFHWARDLHSPRGVWA